MSDDFNQFMKDREAEKELARIVEQDSDAQWDVLKSLTRELTRGKSTDGYSFEWGSLYGDDFLQLGYVAAIFRFRQNQKRERVYEVIFDRHSPSPTGTFLDERSRIAREDWSCEPRIDGVAFVWFVPRLGESYSAERLSNKIAESLVRYCEEYTEAYKNWP